MENQEQKRCLKEEYHNMMLKGVKYSSLSYLAVCGLATIFISPMFIYFLSLILFVVIIIIPLLYITAFISQLLKLTNENNHKIIAGNIYGVMLNVALWIINYDNLGNDSVSDNIPTFFIVLIIGTIIGFYSAKTFPREI